MGGGWPRLASLPRVARADFRTSAVIPPADVEPARYRTAAPMQAGHISVLNLRKPIAGAAGQEIEQVPDRAEIIAGAEARIRHPDDLLSLALKHGDPRLPALAGAKAHVCGKRAARVTDHGKFPAATRSEHALRVRRLRTRHHECGTSGDMMMNAVVAVGPHGAGRARRSHVVNDDQKLMIAEQLRQANRTLGPLELVVADLLRLGGRLRFAHFLANAGDLPPVVGQVCRGVRVFHREFVPYRS